MTLPLHRMEIGKYNSLEIIKQVDFGIYLDGGEYGNILVPKRYVNEPVVIGEKISVFIYRDSEDRLIGTTETPLATVGEFAFLKVNGVSKAGAFLDWGLMKDVLVPFSEQPKRMNEGEKHVVYIYLDESSDRIVATAKTNKFLSKDKPDLKRYETISILVEQESDLGYSCIVNNAYRGLIYHNQVFRPIKIGDRLTAYADRVRPDGKIDVLLEKPGLTKVEEAADKIMEMLVKENGYLPMGDHSSSAEIEQLFQTSKKTFKRAIGLMYRNKQITIENEGIRLIN